MMNCWVRVNRVGTAVNNKIKLCRSRVREEILVTGRPSGSLLGRWQRAVGTV